MKNPCNNCKTRFLCKPYGGKCWIKKLYIRRVSRRIADQIVCDFQKHLDETMEIVKRWVEDADQTKT
jgi:hypothetical protein